VIDGSRRLLEITEGPAMTAYVGFALDRTESRP